MEGRKDTTSITAVSDERGDQTSTNELRMMKA